MTKEIVETLYNDEIMNQNGLLGFSFSMPSLAYVEAGKAYIPITVAYKTFPYEGKTHPRDFKILSFTHDGSNIANVIPLSEDYLQALELEPRDEVCPTADENIVDLIDQLFSSVLNEITLDQQLREKIYHFYKWYLPEEVFAIQKSVCRDFFSILER